MPSEKKWIPLSVIKARKARLTVRVEFDDVSDLEEGLSDMEDCLGAYGKIVMMDQEVEAE